MMTVGATSFGVELRRRRLEAAISLSHLAELVHYTKGYLSKIENGLRAATPDLAVRCDAALDANGRLAALAPERPSPPPGSAVPPRRRHGDPDAPGHTRALAAAGSDETVLTLLESIFEQHRMLGLTASPRVVLPFVVELTTALQAMSGAAARSSYSRLMQLAARCAEYAGWMAQEAGEDDAALWWTEEAVQMAEAVGDLDLVRYGLVRQAEFSLYRRNAKPVLALCTDAQQGGRATRVTGLAVQREAQGHALAGDHDRWRRAMERAAELLAVRDEGSGAAPGPSSAPNMHALVAGWCLVDLGRPDEAADVLDTEVPLLPSAARRAAARFGARRAVAHAAAGDPGAAVALTPELLSVAVQVDSATVRHDLWRLHHELARWERRPAVARTRTDLAEALFPYRRPV